ncbi:transaldolase [Sulfoacidibacillus thermotolerans]|uniref:Transaldolase n=1 Tax=Sulfoacidibacillus thermotolerans TaxID=1765684 RepID=A0A2U3D9X8_SULT2|nr:transaldolase [Sulfoacidibacillus thermotolerans]PWI58075.1 transaldolase [Sulfoacidibacillus thermotolerans]
MNHRLQELIALGQSPWLDYIRKDMLNNGDLERQVASGLRGVTSNPAIFENAIAKSDLYKEAIQQLAKSGASTEAIYEALTTSDIAQAADILSPVFKATEGADGYVSLEVPPDLCDDHEQTLIEARRLWHMIKKPNLMIKVPATAEGLIAIEQLISEGISVNVTLMFTMTDYQQVAEAYLRGLERRAVNGLPLSTVASVASIFVSRIDSAIETLAPRIDVSTLIGKVAVANSRMIYREFTRIFTSERFAKLQALGARVQRPLFASTGTKNKQLSDVLYVNELIGPNTVNTMPPATLEAFLDHGVASRTVDQHQTEDAAILNQCASLGIDLEAIGQDLKQKGLVQFKEAFTRLLAAIEHEVAKVNS